MQLVLDATLNRRPKNATHWSVRSLAEELDISRGFVHRVWRAFGLKPHLSHSFKLSTDPHFIEKVRDVVGLYLDPPDKALVLCVDEKSQIQALDPAIPADGLRFAGNTHARLSTLWYDNAFCRPGRGHWQSDWQTQTPPSKYGIPEFLTTYRFPGSCRSGGPLDSG